MDITRIIEVNIASFKGSKTQQNAAGIFLLKLLSTALTFVAAILIARIVGSDGYGAYNFAISWIAILSMVGLFGMNKLIVREYARLETDNATGLQRGLLRRADLIVISLSILVIGLIWSGAGQIKHLVVEEDSTLLINSLLVALPLIPILALVRVRQAAMEAKRQAFLGNLPELLVNPVMMVMLVAGGWFLFQDEFSAYWAIAAKVSAGVVTLMIVSIIRRAYLPESVKQAKPQYETRKWLSSATPLMLISGLYIVNANTDVIMVGFLGGADATGFYSAASKGALLMTFVMLSVNKTLSPNFASLYKEGNIQKLQSVVTHSVRAVTLVSVLLMIGLVALGHWYLMIFGAEFTVAHLTLAILCFAKVFSGLMGPVGHLLIMTSHENIAAWNVGLAVIINIVLNYVLIPVWGIEGAAVSSLISFIVVNLLQARAVYKFTGLNPTIFHWDK